MSFFIFNLAKLPSFLLDTAKNMAVKVQTMNLKIYVLTFLTIKPNVTFLSKYFILA